MAKRTKEQIDNRANQIRRDDDKTPNLSVGLYDLDFAIKYYIDNEIKPRIIENKEVVEVPVMYASPERWASIKRDGYFRTVKGQIMIPLITYRKSDTAPMPSMYRNADPHAPNLYIETKAKYSKYNRYDQSSITTNTEPVREYHNIVIPTYVNNTYEFIIWTNTTVEMNKLIEGFMYARDSYWGSNDRFKFLIRVGNFSPSIEMSDGMDRFIQTTFTINMNGYIISENIQKELSEFKARGFSKNITIEHEAVTAAELNEPTTYTPPDTSGAQYIGNLAQIVRIVDQHGNIIRTIIAPCNYRVEVLEEVIDTIDNNTIVITDPIN